MRVGARQDGGTPGQAPGAGDVAHDDLASASRRAERSLLQLFLAFRVYHLAAGLVSMRVDRRRFRQPRLGDAAWLLMLAESCWLARRSWRRGAYDETLVTVVDTAAGCAGLFACAFALRPDEQFGSVNWMFPLTLLSALGAAGARRRAESAIAVSALGAAYALATSSQTSTSRQPAFFGVWQYAGCLVGGRILVRQLRGNAAAIEAARRAAVERAERVAQERARSSLQHDLHQGALRALEEVRTLWPKDRDAARLVALREAIRLRHALRGDLEANDSSLTRRLDRVVWSLAGSGLRIETVIDELSAEPSVDVSAAVVEAVEAALRNVIVHANAANAIMRVAELDDMIEVTVRDRGSGSEPRGVPSRVAEPIVRVGGEARWWSAPGRGARVTIRVPK